jgi:transposase
MKILVELSRVQRRGVERLMRETRSRVEAQRCRIVLLLSEGLSAAEVHRLVGCVRSTVYQTLYRFEDASLDGLRDQRHHRPPLKVTDEMRGHLLAYLDQGPRYYGWQRNTWTLELLSLQLLSDTGTRVSQTHVRRLLREEGCRRGRPRPALRIPVQGRRQVLEEIEDIVHGASCEEEVFYVDEADVDLNPRVGLTYIRRSHQPLILTPGTNEKYYVAGALNSRTGTITYSHGPRKNSALFVQMLHELNRRYRRCRKLHLVLDNYIIHKSALTREALARFRGRIELHFLPPYSPESNRIERLWKQMHDHVTRNHQHPTMRGLWKEVERFLENAQPFPGTKVSTLRIAA